MRIARLLAFAALPLLVVACEGGGDPVQQAMRDASTDNQNAALVAGDDAGQGHSAVGHGPASTGPTAADQAFAASEAEMHRLMASASGETLDQSYIAKMVAHHQGAVAMAEVAIRDSRDPAVRRMAQGVIDSQTREIAEMRAWRPATAP